MRDTRGHARRSLRVRLTKAKDNATRATGVHIGRCEGSLYCGPRIRRIKVTPGLTLSQFQQLEGSIVGIKVPFSPECVQLVEIYQTQYHKVRKCPFAILLLIPALCERKSLLAKLKCARRFLLSNNFNVDGVLYLRREKRNKDFCRAYRK